MRHRAEKCVIFGMTSVTSGDARPGRPGSGWSAAPCAPSGAGIGALALVNNVTRQPILGLSPLVDGSVVDLTDLAQPHARAPEAGPSEDRSPRAVRRTLRRC